MCVCVCVCMHACVCVLNLALGVKTCAVCFSLYVHSAVAQWRRCLHSVKLRDSILGIV